MSAVWFVVRAKVPCMWSGIGEARVLFMSEMCMYAHIVADMIGYAPIKRAVFTVFFPPNSPL